MSNAIHGTAQHGFSATAALYQQARPNYPSQMVEWLHHNLDLGTTSTVIDLGAGTGKFLQPLLQITEQVVAVEPVEQMRQQLQQQYPLVKSLTGNSQHIPLTDQYSDAVICAQAFHWFANTESLKEIHRVLKQDGMLGLVWNQRDENCAWVKEIADVLLGYEQDTPRFHSQQWQQVFQDQALFKSIGLSTFEHQHRGRVEDVVTKRLLSTSFIAAMPEVQQLELKQQFEQIVFEHTGKQAQDQIIFPYLTYAYHYQKI